MLNSLKKSLEIDLTYGINSFFYILQGLPIFKDLITNDIYASSGLKKIIRVFAAIFQFLKMLVLKFFYFFIIFSLSYYLFFNNMVKSYFHLYFIATLLGIFINNKLLNTSKKKYFSLLLFQMDGINYFRSNLLWNQGINFILNSICIFFFGHLIASPIRYNIMLIVLSFFSRLIGEAGNIIFYKKKNYIWYSNTKYYGAILLFFIGLMTLPYFKIFISLRAIYISTILITILGIFTLNYLWKIKDYKTMYQKLSQATNIMDSKNDKDYLQQAMVAVTKKDQKIDSKKLKGKKGYDLFNTIFFERHKHILIRSAKKYSVLLIGIYIVLGYLVLSKNTYKESIELFMNNKLGWFVVIMYYINRGAIITQAMFFNCDHAMLCYNFYREPKIILELFKKRLSMVAKVNLLPATVIGIGNAIIQVLTGTNNIITIVSTFLFIIFLSIFFSVHYLVIYYLLQPFNKNLEVKKASYSFATLGTYILSYQMTRVVMNSLQLSLLGLTLTILYIFISLGLVYKYAPKTFKLD